MKAILVYLLLATLSAISFGASAARNSSINYVYFDVNGTPVGQRAYFCNGKRLEGGDTTTPYYLKVTDGCDGRIICTPKGQCHIGDDPSHAVLLLGNPPFTKEEACQLAGEMVCLSMEPWILYEFGWTPS